MDFKNTMVCPKCRIRLTDDIECLVCKRKYPFEHMVYDLNGEEDQINEEFSFWNITDDELEAEKIEEQEWERDYIAHKNAETIEAEQKLDAFMQPYFSQMRGLCVDIATGRGQLLRKILSWNRSSFLDVLCTDIDPRILAMTRKKQQTNDAKVAYMGTNASHLSIKDNCAEYVSSLAGLCNVPNPKKACQEVYRILRQGGRLYYATTLLKKESRSYEKALTFGEEIAQALNQDELLQMLHEVGFQTVECHVVAEAEWAENPYDGIPLAGDTQQYAFVIAQK